LRIDNVIFIICASLQKKSLCNPIHPTTPAMHLLPDTAPLTVRAFSRAGGMAVAAQIAIVDGAPPGAPVH
jgi:hypothetical protein